MTRPALAALLLATVSCGRTAPTAEPEYLATNPPSALTECVGHHPCWCDGNQEELWAQAANDAVFRVGYPGNGSRFVTIVTPDSSLCRVWPQGLCGDLMALSWPLWTTEGFNFREHEIVRRTLWFRAHDGFTLRLVPGRGYWLGHGDMCVPIPATIDTLVLGGMPT